MISAVLGVLCFGFADALWRPNVLRYGHYKLLLHRTLLTTMLLGCFFIYNLDSQTFNISGISIALLSGGVAGFGLYFLVKAFNLENTTNRLFLNIVTLLVSQFFSFLLFQNPLDWEQYIIHISFSILAILCFNQFNFKISKGIKYGLFASVCFGVAYPLSGIPINDMGYTATIFTQELVICTGIILMTYKKGLCSIDMKIYFDYKIIALSVLSTMAVIMFFYSYTLIEIYKVNLISNFHPVGGLLVAMIFFNEKISFYQCCGVIISVSTCLLISGLSF